MFYTNFEPKMKNRFIMNIDGIDSYLIKTANRTISFEPVTLVHINVRENWKEKVSERCRDYSIWQLFQVEHNKWWSGWELHMNHYW